jgi:hypothetical protein
MNPLLPISWLATAVGDGNNPDRFGAINVDDGEWKLAEQDVSRFFKVCQGRKSERVLGYTHARTRG